MQLAATVRVLSSEAANQQPRSRSAAEIAATRVSRCGGRTDRDLMMARWELWQYASTETAGELCAATLAPDEWRSTM
jgi:hypothetical protein